MVKDAIRRHPAVSGVYTVVDGGDEESIIYDIVVKVEAETRRDLDDAESYFLVLSDMRMPALSGIQLSKKVKEVNPNVKVVLMTGRMEI